MDTTTISPCLCDRCNSLDIDAVLSPESHGQTHPRVVLELDHTRLQSSKLFCTFCRLMTRVEPLLGDDSTARDLVLCSTPLRGRLFDTLHETIGLCVLEKSATREGESLDYLAESLSRAGYIASTTPPKSVELNGPPVRGREIDPQMVDYSILRGWLLHCQTKHHACNRKKASQYPERMTLINCYSRELERTSSQRSYIALSYVWGEHGERTPAVQLKNGVLLYPMPRTIEDAISVTKCLGYEYLWVDKYCIDRFDAEEMAKQIQQMDLVYCNAELTIVAGAGDNADFGLPGVSDSHRYPQPTARIGSHLLVALLGDPAERIKNSTWMSRGWTFQEALLSRRLLVFTEQQVYFECSLTNFCETIDYTRRDWEAENILFKPNEQRRWPWYILSRLSEYTKRKLSFEDDILNAFLGVLKFYERSKYPVYNHWGVPILPSVVKGERGWPDGVSRAGREGFLRGLCWSQTGPGERRHGFPSWSWTGWRILVRSDSEEYEHGLRMKHWRNIDVWIEDQQQSVLHWPLYSDLWTGFDRTKVFSHYIWLLAYTIKLTFFFDFEPRAERTKSLRYWPDFHIDERLCIQTRFYPLPKTEKYVMYPTFEPTEYHAILTTKTFLGVILGESRRLSSETRSFVMVIENKGDYFERIGHIILETGSLRLFDKFTQQAVDYKATKETLEIILHHQELRTIRIG